MNAVNWFSFTLNRATWSNRNGTSETGLTRAWLTQGCNALFSFSTLIVPSPIKFLNATCSLRDAPAVSMGAEETIQRNSTGTFDMITIFSPANDHADGWPSSNSTRNRSTMAGASRHQNLEMGPELQ